MHIDRQEIRWEQTARTRAPAGHGGDPSLDRAHGDRKPQLGLYAHLRGDVLAAADFFTVEVWTGRGLTRFAVLFLIELSTRRIEIAGITSEPDAAWMSKVSRNVTDASDGFLTGTRFLIHDRDPRFTLAFRETLTAADVHVVLCFANIPTAVRITPKRALRRRNEDVSSLRRR